MLRSEDAAIHYEAVLLVQP